MRAVGGRRVGSTAAGGAGLWAGLKAGGDWWLVMGRERERGGCKGREGTGGTYKGYTPTPRGAEVLAKMAIGK